MSSLNRNRDAEYIRNISQKALSLMSQYQVAPSSSNYQIWYEYVGEENLSLNKAIDDLIKKGKKITCMICENLYQKFFSNDIENETVSKVSAGVQGELVKIARLLGDTNKGTLKFNAALGESLQNIADIPGGQELKSIISGILTETKEISEVNKIAQQKLKESTKSVQKLQMALESTRQEIMTDALTGIGNRRAFNENLKQTIGNVPGNGDDLCLIFGDIDHFKKFNDHWGHHVGDQVLKVVAHTMKTMVGESGFVTRFGGEEFTILMPGISLEAAFAVADEIREAISQRRMKRKSTGENIGKITCSFGIAKYRHDEEPHDFLERADTALYSSKSNGRNRVSLEDEGQKNVVNIA